MNKLTLGFAKCREGAIIPSKKDENAGYDIFPVIEKDITICPGEIAMIPTGIKSVFNKAFVGILEERGSTGTKGMSRRAGIIDSGYRGEWFVPINNTSNVQIIISHKFNDMKKPKHMGMEIHCPANQAVCQVVFQEVPNLKVVEMSEEDLMAIESERGDSCLGASNK